MSAKRHKPNTCDWDAICSGLPYLSAKELCEISTLCKDIHLRVTQNDNLWRGICQAAGGQEITKLPTHTWKEAYKQIRQHNKEMELEAESYQLRYQRWRDKQRNYACGMRSGPPIPKFRMLNSTPFLPTTLPGGFKEHPSSKVEPVLTFSVDLIQVSKTLLEMLQKARRQEFSNEDFLAQAVQRYVNFLHLKHKHKHIALIPTLEIEYVWVSHMLRPSMYIQDCTRLFGEVIDHDILLRTAYNCFNKENSLKVTAELYKKEFKAPYCSDHTIEKYSTVHHYNLTGCAPLEPTKDDVLTDNGVPFRSPYKSVEVTLAPSFIADIGEVGNGPVTAKLAGLSISDLQMDEMWLEEFQNYMKKAIKDLQPNDIIGMPGSSNAYYNASKMSTKEIFKLILKAYEKFLFMAAKYPPTKGNYIHPSYAIDVIWHSHMICPKIYAKEVSEWVGYLVDHEPWPECKKQDMDASAAQTDDLWRKEFGHTTRVCKTGNENYRYDWTAMFFDQNL